jgi:hypothetical protein
MNTIWIIFGLVIVTLSIYAMISVVISNMDNNRKILWFVIVALIPVIGPIAYYSIKPHKS